MSQASARTPCPWGTEEMDNGQWTMTKGSGFRFFASVVAHVGPTRHYRSLHCEERFDQVRAVDRMCITRLAFRTSQLHRLEKQGKE
jgi:hypothetical protein